jgi:hypothetical protein
VALLTLALIYFLKKTQAVERILKFVLSEFLFAGRQIIEPVDCFICMFAEKKSYANYFYFAKQILIKINLLTIYKKIFGRRRS